MDELGTLILDTQERLLADWQAGWSHVSSLGEAIQLWTSMGPTGLLGALGPEETGGLGSNADFVFEFMVRWGRYAAPGAAITTLVGGQVLLANTACAGLLEGIADGSIRLAIPTWHHTAFPGQDAGPAAADSGAVVAAVAIMRDASFATHAILPGKIGSDPAVLCVETGQLPLSAPFRLIDGSTAASLEETRIALPEPQILWRGKAARDCWAAATERMTAAAAAEAVGLLRTMLEQTAAYVRQRKQFGQTIGSFQAVQHRMADMLVDVEQAHSLALAAVRDPHDPVLVSSAKARVNRSLQFVANQAVQLHGGIGTTQELALSRYFKRALVLAAEFGTTPEHLQRVEAGLAARLTSSKAIA